MNLHLKIFLGFWLAMLGIVGAWLITDQYVLNFSDSFHQQAFRDWSGNRERPRGERSRRPLLPRGIFRIHYALQNLPLDELPNWIERQERDNPRLQIQLFNQNGEEILGNIAMPGALDALRKLDGSRRPTGVKQGEYAVFAQEIYRRDEGGLAVVIATRPPTSPFIQALTEYFWLRLLLAVIMTGLISFAVSRYLTRPLKVLQNASRKLAQGELSTRIALPAHGGDETAELGRDFNTMADQLQRQIESQKRLLNDVSHELRSPLARLRVALALAERDPDNAAGQLTRIAHETGRLDELIAQLLSVPEYEVELKDSVDLVGLLRELCSDAHYEAEAEDKKVRLLTSMPEAIIRTHGDLLTKAVENIIRNAIHHTRADTEVRVEFSQSANHYKISVCDRGPGIPGEDLDKIFDPFFRVDRARTHVSGGYGLGLAIARQSVIKHRGEIKARNNNQGLCIEIILPQG